MKGTCRDSEYCYGQTIRSLLWDVQTLRLDDRDPVTVKNVSSLPWVLPLNCTAHLNCFSEHMNWMRPSSSGSFHLRSTVVQSTTSGFRKRPRASLKSQSSGLSRISSILPCSLIRSIALLGPIPLMVPQ
uniref:Uncharacterized protein n=1 Tax=Denticeps clupeoides TaxID=299321 RepID=A0AAY4B9Y9_9TELE